MEPPVESALLEWSGQGAPTPCSLGEPLQQAPDTWVSSPGCPLGRGVLSPLSLLILLSCPHCPSLLRVRGPSCCCLPLLRAPAAVELLLGDQEGTAWCHGCGAGPTSSAGLCPPATAMELPSFCSHPLWFVLALLLGMLLWATRRRAWDPHKCPTDLTGKTVIVTGANSGERASVAPEGCGAARGRGASGAAPWDGQMQDVGDVWGCVVPWGGLWARGAVLSCCRPRSGGADGCRRGG